LRSFFSKKSKENYMNLMGMNLSFDNNYII
jgi:hypothetical protein